ncbi:MAG: response regulator [Actinomycetes bacterium]
MSGRTVLVATDADEVFDEVDAALSDEHTDVARVRAGRDVVAAIRQLEPDLVVLDLQIGNMGGVATCLAIRNEESGGRLDEQQVLLLLDRTADEYLAQQADADGWLVKPLDAMGLRRAVAAIDA